MTLQEQVDFCTRAFFVLTLLTAITKNIPLMIPSRLFIRVHESNQVANPTLYKPSNQFYGTPWNSLSFLCLCKRQLQPSYRQ